MSQESLHPGVDIPALLRITTGRELAQLLGVHYEKQILYFTYRHPAPYRTYEVAKKSGKGTRTISAPVGGLAYIQHQLSQRLNELYKPRACAHGFVAGRSIVTNADGHKAATFVLNIDLVDFFPTIHHGRVNGALVAIGISPLVAKLISHICTYKGNLPQGAPTSPVLSNIICWRLDKRLTRLAQDNRSFYTRYADDITFSTFRSRFPAALAVRSLSDEGNKLELGAELNDAVTENGFQPNPEKTRLQSRGQRQEVTGLVVNERLNVPRQLVRNIRACLFKWETLGQEVIQAEFESKYSRSRRPGVPRVDVEEHIRGKLGYVAHIKGERDPVVLRLVARFNALATKPFPPLAPLTDPWMSILERAVWVIETHDDWGGEGGQGTAFFLKDVGLVTCFHCVVPGAPMVVYNPSAPATKYPVTIESGNETVDLAILGHQVPSTAYIEIPRNYREQTHHGLDIRAAGWPDFSPGDHLTVRPGVIIGYKVKSTIQRIRVSSAVIYGNSGGPVFDFNNRLIGIAVTGAGTLLEAEASKDNALVPVGALELLT